MDPRPRLSRRDALRLIGGGSLAALVPALALRPEPASAARVWCRSDPLFQVGNKLVDVTIGTYDDMFGVANGPVQIILWTPLGVPTSLLYADGGFGYGYAITYAVDPALKGGKNNPQVRVQVMCPATEALPVSVYYSTLTDGKRLEFRSTEHVATSNQFVTVNDTQKVATSTVSTTSSTSASSAASVEPTATPKVKKKK